MCESVTKAQPNCLLGCICAPCCVFSTRLEALEHDVSKYRCCQGYMDGACCCFKSGMCCEETCPYPCLCIESFCCLGPAMSSTRIYVMDMYELTSDPCDRRIIRLTNCLMILSCICDIAAIFQPDFREWAHILRMIADLVFYSTMGCMVGQVRHELFYQRANGNKGIAEGGHQPPVAHAEPYDNAVRLAEPVINKQHY